MERSKRKYPILLGLLLLAAVLQTLFSLWTLKLAAFPSKLLAENRKRISDFPTVASLTARSARQRSNKKGRSDKTIKLRNKTTTDTVPQRLVVRAHDKHVENTANAHADDSFFTLPSACQPKPGSYATASSHSPGFHHIANELEGLPSEYFHSRIIPNYSQMKMIAYLYDRKTNQTKIERQAPIEAPQNQTLVCFPNGIIIDNSVAGPYPLPSDSNETKKSVPTFYLEQNKRWNANGGAAQKFLQREPLVHSYSGLGVQVSSSMGFTWNHFPVDSALRLALVYDKLMDTSDKLWNSAKLVVSGDFTGRDIDTNFDPLVLDVFKWLNLTDRVVSTNGWIVRANHTLQFDYLVLPDFSPYPMCGPNSYIVDAVYPRNALLPLQRAFGSLPSNEKKYIVYAGRVHAKRNVEPRREEEILDAVRALIKELDIGLELIVFDYYKDYHHDDQHSKLLDHFRHTDVVFGPHGAQLWNALFVPPGGLLMEFSTWEAEFAGQDCRTYAYSLANAAGLSYALIDTDNFDFEGVDMLPRTDFVIQALRNHWTKTT